MYLAFNSIFSSYGGIVTAATLIKDNTISKTHAFLVSKTHFISTCRYNTEAQTIYIIWHGRL